MRRINEGGRKNNWSAIGGIARMKKGSSKNMYPKKIKNQCKKCNYKRKCKERKPLFQRWNNDQEGSWKQ